jgi:TetR/AcrR family transcriptional regulator, tetracycline repressor protein
MYAWPYEVNLFVEIAFSHVYDVRCRSAAAGCGAERERIMVTDQPSTSRARVARPTWVGIDPSQDELPRPPLTRPRVVRTALCLVDQHGLCALTMRALATELQVSPMALYNHVRDKDELIDLMVDLMLGEVDLSATAGDWATQMRALACSYHQTLTAHPALARAYSTQIRIGPHGLRLMERTLEILLQAGFSPPAAADAFIALFTYIVGYHQIGRADPQDYTALPPEQIPAITTAAPHLSGLHHKGRFEYGLDALLTGLHTTHNRNRNTPETCPGTGYRL